jgi:hypothetical protein
MLLINLHHADPLLEHVMLVLLLRLLPPLHADDGVW